MINAHEFQQAAKKFRAGRITLSDFTALVFDGEPARKPTEGGKSSRMESKSDTAPGTNVEPGAVAKVNLIKRLAPLPSRLPQSHKGNFGRVLAIGGSEGMAGAISLTGLAALRTGSGLVRVAVPEMIQSLVAGINPCLMTIGCLAENDGFHGAAEGSLSHHSEWADVIAIGPGMGRGGAQQWILKKLFADVQQPMVVDADGLNAMADAEVDLCIHEGQRVLTPHPGEFQRIAKTKITNRSEMESAARELASATKTTIVLKGHQTFVTDGEKDFRNSTGNPGMATAGSGDVLTGVITSLIGQGLSLFDASALGVCLHGMAGDFAAETTGEASLIASDIVEHLPAALKAHANQSDGRIGF
jgi:NAD(P)H-hydrate epimerase